jgi:hypothetical protein
MVKAFMEEEDEVQIQEVILIQVDLMEEIVLLL